MKTTLMTFFFVSLFTAQVFAQSEEKESKEQSENQVKAESKKKGEGEEEKLKTLKSSDTFKVVVWNIYKGNRKGFKKQFREFIKDSQLMLLQEVYLTKSLKTFHDSFLGWKWVFGKSFTMNNMFAPDADTGVGTYARWDYLDEKVLKSSSTEPFSDTPKVSLFTRYPIYDEKGEKLVESLLVINTHGINFNVGFGAFDEQMKAVVEEAKEHKGPMIWAGDFNTWNEGRVKVMSALAKKLGLTEVFFPAWKNHRKKFRGYALDRVYYRGLKIVSKEVIKNKKASDHNPIVIELTFKKEEEKKEEIKEKESKDSQEK